MQPWSHGGKINWSVVCFYRVAWPTHIFRHVPGRTAVQCLQHYKHVLRPGIERGSWTAEEVCRFVVFAPVWSRLLAAPFGRLVGRSVGLLVEWPNGLPRARTCLQAKFLPYCAFLALSTSASFSCSMRALRYRLPVEDWLDRGATLDIVMRPPPLPSPADCRLPSLCFVRA